MHITERIVERNWGNAKSVWFSHVTLQNREGTFSKFRSLHVYLSGYIFKCHNLSSRKDWTDKEARVKALGSSSNYSEEHYCEEFSKNSVLPKKRMQNSR